MYRLTLILFLVLPLFIASCGGGGGSDSASSGACSTLRVTNGESCTSRNNPVVFLNINGGRNVCSGTLVTRTSILTAAHCLVGAETIEAVHSNVSEVITEGFLNGLYPGGVHPFDIAILKVSTQFSDTANFNPVGLIVSRPVNIGDTTTIFGFGLDENDNINAFDPKAGTVDVLAVEDGFILLENVNGSISRSGDSGGPVIFSGETENGIVATISGGDPDGTLTFASDLRIEGNVNFLRELAGDIALRSDQPLEHAIRWTPSSYF